MTEYRHELGRDRRSLPKSPLSCNSRSHFASFMLGAICMACITWIQPAQLKQLLVEQAGISSNRTINERSVQNLKLELIHVDHQAACENYTESIDAFIRDVANRTEKQALSRWEYTPFSSVFVNSTNTITNDTHTNTKWVFPQLDRDLLESAFGGKKVALVGDSTMFYLMQWLHQLLQFLPEDFVQTMATRYPQQTPAFRAVETYLKHTPYGGIEYTEDFVFRRNLTSHQRKEVILSRGKPSAAKSAHIKWLGFNGGTMQHNCEFDTLVWPQLLEHRPDIIVANWGLHMLFRPKVQECNVPQFLNYEQFFLERILQVARDVGTRLVLFKTTNRMCKDEAVTVAKHAIFCNQTLLHDIRHHESFVQRFGLNDSQLAHYCAESAFVEASARRLNERLALFVANAKTNPLNANITIEIYNDHDLESCGYTQWNDGVHFQLLAFPRIRLLAHMIECLWDNTQGE